jgi:hypothetical protein
MRVLKTEDCFYVGGGDDGDGSDGTGHDGYANDNVCDSAGAYASNPDKDACIARCSMTALPTPDFGAKFARCMAACYSPLGGHSDGGSGSGGGGGYGGGSDW